MTYRIRVDERRARVAVRHHIAPTERVGSVVHAAHDLVCLHATDPATVYLSAWARMTHPAIEAVDRALYHDRSLVRMLAMRRTMFVIPTEEVPFFHAAAALAIARTERKRNEALAAMLGVRHPAAWLRKAEAAALTALEQRREATAQELAADVPALRRKVRLNIGKRYEGDIGMSSRVLLLLALEGKVVRGRPRGTWVSSQYRWAPMDRWLGRPMPTISASEAQVEVIRRWLSRFGPGTELDIRWWTGWTARVVRSALATIGAVEVDLDGQRGFVLRNGNAGPTIWVNGRIVGGWAIRKGGEVVSRLLEDVGRASSLAVEAQAPRLTTWLGAAPSVPGFPTPLAKELMG